MARALKHRKSRWLLVRSTRTRLSQTVLVTLEEQVFPLFGIVPPSGGRENRQEYKLPNGSALIPMALDDPQRTQSAEVSGIYVAEGVELGKADDVLSLAGAMRLVGVDYYQCLVDANPGPPGHWLNQIAEPAGDDLRAPKTLDEYRKLLAFNAAKAPPGRWKRIITTHYDNPGYFDAARWQWTEQGKTYLETLNALQGYLRARWLEGRWVAAEGSVFGADFVDARNVCEPFDVPPDWPWWVHLDPGYDHPCAIAWFTMSPNGTIYVADLRYQSGQTIAEHAEWIKGRLAGRNVQAMRLDPRHGFSRTAQSPKTIAEQFREHGLTFYPWPRKSGEQVQALVNATRGLLRDGRLKFFRGVTDSAIAEMQSWSYKRTAAGALVAGDDAFVDAQNDFIDGLLGFVATNPTGDNRGVSVCSMTQQKPKPMPVYY
jgi:hypothetical protein